MSRTTPSSERARAALLLVERLQRRLADRLRDVAVGRGLSEEEATLKPVEWLRDEGRHGGGVRLVTGDTAVFNRASVNVSSVHYDDLPDRKLGSATALSSIVHPTSPHGPSVHLHISWTEMRPSAPGAEADGYWRIMADLNPSLPSEPARDAFQAALRAAAGDRYDEAAAQGDRYFYIPALKRHRGVTHFYLEAYRTSDPAADAALAEGVATAAIDAYASLLSDALAAHATETSEEQARQLAYHTLYFFQVLTLDRGTTSGLLVHDQNDVGILGSLPARIDRHLLASWRDRLPSPQERLLDGLLAALPEVVPTPVDEPTKAALAQAVRQHYRAHPEALALQASGDIIPPTVDNHR